MLARTDQAWTSDNTDAPNQLTRRSVPCGSASTSRWRACRRSAAT
ncbi:hypothetical protein ABZ611_30460 [Streptomyces sp. NPDC007861]